MILVTDEIQAQECGDAEFVDRVVGQLWPQVSTDAYPKPLPAGALIGTPDYRFIEVDLFGVPSGLVLLYKQEVHTLFLPHLRGRMALRAARAVLTYIWDTTDFPFVTSYAYSHRPEVLWFAKRAGFTAAETIDDGSTIGGAPVLRTNLICNRP